MLNCNKTNIVYLFFIHICLHPFRKPFPKSYHYLGKNLLPK